MGTSAGLTKERIRQNAHQLDVLSADDLIYIWEQTKGKSISALANSGSVLECSLPTIKTVANYVAPTMDAVLAAKIIRDLGLNGKVVTKVVQNRTYVIFKGLPGTRSIFTGTRYLAANPKVVDMAIGKAGVAKSVVSGARVTIFLVVPINILQYIMDDQQTMSDLVGTTATDLVKVGVATFVAGLAGTAVAGVTTLAAGPLIVAIVVGVAVGYALDELDRHFGVTDRLIEALDELVDDTNSTIDSFFRGWNQIENTLRWQAINGGRVGKGIFY